jgi:hypothetical protein
MKNKDELSTRGMVILFLVLASVFAAGLFLSYTWWGLDGMKPFG